MGKIESQFNSKCNSGTERIWFEVREIWFDKYVIRFDSIWIITKWTDFKFITGDFFEKICLAIWDLSIWRFDLIWK